MNWRSFLRVKTRDPQFLWGMVLSVLGVGVVAGLVVDWAVDSWFDVETMARLEAPDDNDEPDGPMTSNQLQSLAKQGEWWPLWKAIPRLMAERARDRWGVTALATLTGACWMAFLLQAGQMRRRGDIRLWAPVAGLPLGVLSIWPTLFFIFWQEHVWGLNESSEFTQGIQFFVLGVGLREELSKFLCFALLLPLLLRWGDELAALVSAAAVGIGFAMEENLGYFSGSLGTDALGRLLTAAPLHMSMTGLIGLAAYRACRWPRDWGPHFLAMFGVIVLAHGMYDALIVLPALEHAAIGAIIIFLAVIYQFFRELRPLQALRIETISLTANFLFCVSTVAAATFVYLCAAIGCKAAGDVLVGSIASEAVMAYLFLREMPETMVRV